MDTNIMNCGIESAILMDFCGMRSTKMISVEDLLSIGELIL